MLTANCSRLKKLSFLPQWDGSSASVESGTYLGNGKPTPGAHTGSKWGANFFARFACYFGLIPASEPPHELAEAVAAS